MNNLRNLRKLFKETQEDVGKLLGVTKATISKYENETIAIPNDSLYILSTHYNTTIDDILSNTKEDKYSKYKHLNNSLIGRVSNKMEGMSEDELDLLDKLIDKIIKDDK